MDVPSQSGITSDNVTLSIDGVLYIKVVDPYSASYGIEDYIYAVSQLAQTTMRSEIGKLTLDKIFQERETLNQQIVGKIHCVTFSLFQNRSAISIYPNLFHGFDLLGKH